MKILLFLSGGGVLLIATACGHVTRVAAASKPLEVLVADVQQKDVPLYREWIGTVDGFVNAEIKAQVAGYLVKQAYTEGSSVRRGQLLFEEPRIDPHQVGRDAGLLRRRQLPPATVISHAISNDNRLKTRLTHV